MFFKIVLPILLSLAVQPVFASAMSREVLRCQIPGGNPSLVYVLERVMTAAPGGPVSRFYRFMELNTSIQDPMARILGATVLKDQSVSVSRQDTGADLYKISENDGADEIVTLEASFRSGAPVSDSAAIGVQLQGIDDRNHDLSALNTNGVIPAQCLRK